MDLSVAIIVAGLVIIVIMLIVSLIDFSAWNTVIASGVGGGCIVITDCGNGLTCSNQTCLIPDSGSCIRRTDRCLVGSTCFQGQCTKSVIISVEPIPQSRIMSTDTHPISISLPSTPLSSNGCGSHYGNVTPRSLGCSPSSSHPNYVVRGLHITNNPSEDDPSMVVPGDILDCFYHRGYTYVIFSDDPSTVVIYSGDVKTMTRTLSFPLQTPVHVVDDKLYTTRDGYLFQCVFQRGRRSLRTMNFTPVYDHGQPVKASYISSNAKGTYLYVQSHPLSGTTMSIVPIEEGNLIYVTDTSIIHHHQGRETTHAKVTDNIAYINGSLYQYPQRCKSYVIGNGLTMVMTW